MPRAGASSQRGGLDREGALAVGGPAPCFVAAGAAGDHVDLVGDHEGRVEADAELADQGRAFAGLAGFEPLHEGLGAGARDGAERLDHLVVAHADAVVLDGEALGVGVELDGDARLGVVAEQRRRGDGLVAQPFAGVGGVRDQFAQEHVLVGIDRVHHQVQQARNVGLEGAAFGFGVGSGGHGGSEIPGGFNRLPDGEKGQQIQDHRLCGERAASQTARGPPVYEPVQSASH